MSYSAPVARAPLIEAEAWIDKEFRPLGSEMLPVARACGRVLAGPVAAREDMPPVDWAAVDGIALAAAETEGAGAYNPLPFPARFVRPGAALPADCDAVLPLERAGIGPSGTCEVIEPLVRGSCVWSKGSHYRRGLRLADDGRRIAAADLALLAGAGITEVPVRRRPRVQLIVLPYGGPDGLSPMLGALVARDGGDPIILAAPDRRPEIVSSLFDDGADLVLVAGGSGRGSDDLAAQGFSERCALRLHGLALSPGESAGLGRTLAGRPFFLLPGVPAEALWAYEMLVGRAVRKLAGLPTGLALPRRRMRAERKIVSRIGMAEIVPVDRTGEDSVAPRARFAERGLGALGWGVVLFSAGSEGCPVGGLLDVRVTAPEIDTEEEKTGDE